VGNLYLGCPMWGLKTWPGVFFPPGAKTRDFLAHYSTRLNTVEGNTTFYALPSDEIAMRWRDEAAPGFRFCLKVPREISHDRRLQHAEAATAAFVRLLRLMGEKAGPSFLQLPPTFDAGQLRALDAWLAAWPRDLPLAVEPRHPAFWASAEDDFLALLHAHGVQRCCFDTVGLFATDPAFNQHAIDATHRKPQFARRLPQAGAPFTFVRFVGPADVAACASWLAPIAEAAAQQLASGGDAYVFTHHADDTHAPAVARLFHAQVAAHITLPTLPEWGEPEQGRLF
jgi:uncharacterized protein YecE (DUF72 family)